MSAPTLEDEERTVEAEPESPATEVAETPPETEVEAPVEDPFATEREEHKERLRRLIREQEERWRRMNDASCALADHQGWCSEFDRIVAPLGFWPRGSKPHRRMAAEVICKFQGTLSTQQFPSERATEVLRSVYPNLPVVESIDGARHPLLRFEFSVVIELEFEAPEGARASRHISASQIRREVAERWPDLQNWLYDWSFKDRSIRTVGEQPTYPTYNPNVFPPFEVTTSTGAVIPGYVPDFQTPTPAESPAPDPLRGPLAA